MDKKLLRALNLTMSVLLFVFLDTAFAQIQHPRQPDTAKECAICHYRWVYAFFVEHRGSPLAPLSEKKVVGDKEMCFSCHDGSVRDSRDAICNEPGHRVGVIPSDRVVIPEKFPLDDKGALQCATCHTPHAITKKQGTIVEYFLRAPNKDSSFCKLCHVKNTGGIKQGNHPLNVSLEKPPGEILKAGGRFGSAQADKVICQTCHIAHGGVNNEFLVLPVEDLRTRSVLCESCHTKNPVIHKKKSIIQGKSHPVDLCPKNAQLPKQWSHGKKIITGNNGEVVCRTCHSPHNAVEKKALLADKNHRDSLCTQCHQKERAVSGSTHDLSTSAWNEKNARENKAHNMGPCSSCHMVHGGGKFFLWARRLKGEIGNIDGLCLDCHSTGACAERALPGVFTHPVDVSVQIGSAIFPLPLFDTEGRENKGGKVRCLTCHDVHNPSPLYHDHLEKNVNRGKYLRIIQGKDSKLCTLCHKQHGFVKGTDHDLGITAPHFKNILGQTPAQGGLCSPCHVVHNAGQQKYLWSAPMGPSIFDKWNQSYSSGHNVMVELCTGCHAPGQIAEQQMPQFGLHPKGFVVPEDEFLEGRPKITFEMVKEEFPLFTDTGEVNEKGSIVCSTCHNPHQWDPHREAKGEGFNIEGNVTNSFLRPNIPSKLCRGCHGKDALFKFKYFHSHISREEEKESFPFE